MCSKSTPHNIVAHMILALVPIRAPKISRAVCDEQGMVEEYDADSDNHDDDNDQDDGATAYTRVPHVIEFSINKWNVIWILPMP
jgi:hypothetical protein